MLGFDYSKIEYGAFDKQFVDYYGLTKEQLNQDVSSLTFKNIDKELSKFIKKCKKDHLELIKKNRIKL